MKYFRGWTGTPIEKWIPAISDKAYCFTIAGGATSANDTHEWFPKSQIKIGQPNEVGNAEILIPYWLMKNKHHHAPEEFFRRIREIEAYNGEDLLVER